MDCFFDVVSSVLESERPMLAKETIKTYRFILSKFEKRFPQIICKEITPNVIIDFREYMIQIGNEENTISKTLAGLKTLTNKVRGLGLILDDPFLGVHIKKVSGRRHFLSKEELKDLFSRFMLEHSLLSQPEADAMQAFLFSCYTGLRYLDLKTLKKEEIINGKIRKQMHKTGDYVYIPLVDQAISLLSISSDPLSNYVLRVTENSYFNRKIRSASVKLGFMKYLHCHLARHTFATICLTLGIPLEVVSKLLGHKNISTTLIYAKYVDSVLDNEMQKFKLL